MVLGAAPRETAEAAVGAPGTERKVHPVEQMRQSVFSFHLKCTSSDCEQEVSKYLQCVKGGVWMLTEIIREEVSRYDLTFKAVAQTVNVASSTLSQYISGDRRMTKEMEGSIIEAINSPRLSEERCFSCRGNLFPTRYLDNIDDHPIVALDKVIEEAEEFIEAAKDARRALINKRRGTVFDEEADRILKRFEDDCADMVTGAKTVLIKLQEWFQRPVIVVMHRHLEKLERMEYCTKRKKPPMKAAR